MSNVIPIHGSTRGSKYGPGSPYDLAARAARDLPAGPAKAEAFERAAEHALGCTYRSGGWTALGECNCRINPRSAPLRLGEVEIYESGLALAAFKRTQRRGWILVAALWSVIAAAIVVLILSQWPVL